MTQRLEAQGCKKDENKWDDGSDHDNVTKIFVRGDSQGIQSIQFNYIKDGQPKDGSFHGYPFQGFTQTFEINHLKDEQLESVEVYYEHKLRVIQGIQFKTNLRISELIGIQNKCTKFSLSVDGKKIIGFHGSASVYLNSLGAYFKGIAPTRLEAKGGKGGDEWDDGADHDDVIEIWVHGSCNIMQFIRFSYVKDDGSRMVEQKIGSTYSTGYTQTFQIDHLNNEYLVSVEGYYDDDIGIINGLKFKTNLDTSNLIGSAKGKKFSLGAYGKKIIGFHGYAEKNLKSLGAYFTTSPFTKLEYIGFTTYGSLWDDGAYEGIRKVYIYCDNSGVKCLRFNYEDGGKVKSLEHGCKEEQEEEDFVVNYPNEFITSVEGSFQSNGITNVVSSLTFTTSKGRISPTFGSVTNIKFLLHNNGSALVGFHGYSERFIMALGAYFRPLPPLPDAEKLEAQGGDGGVSWDDGGFDGIRKIYIGHNELGIAFVKLLYDQENQAVVGDDHGNKKIHRIEEFELDYPSEYLISVEGKYDVVDGSESEVILMLKFMTNMKSSQTFGLKTTSKNFTVKKECHKIVGFHGKSSNILHQIGIHVLPI